MPMDSVFRPTFDYPTPSKGGESFADAPASPSAPAPAESTTPGTAVTAVVTRDERGQIVRPAFNYDNDGTPRDAAPAQLPELPIDKPDDVAALASLDPALVSRWQSTGGLQHHLNQVRATVSSVMQQAGEGGAALESSFEALPQTVQTAAYEMMSLQPSHSALAVEKMFADRVNALSPTDRAAFAQWWRSLSDEALTAVTAAIYGNSK
jgi:hypothetical protein